MKTPKQMPLYRAYTTVKQQDDKKDFWLPIGAAFEHRDQKGISLVLQAIPLNGRIIMRPFEEKPQEPVAV